VGCDHSGGVLIEDEARLLGTGVPVAVGLAPRPGPSPVVSFEQFLVPRSELPPEPWEGRRRLGLRGLLVLGDLAAIGCGALLSSGALVFGGSLLVLSAMGGLYRSRLVLSLLDDLPRVLGRLLVALALSAALSTTLSAALSPAPVAVAVTAGASVLLRGVVYEAVRFGRRTRRITHPTVILGAGQVGRYLAETLLEHPRYGLQPIGFVDGFDPGHPLPLLGPTEHLARVLEQHDVRNLIVAFGAMREPELVDVLRTCDRLNCEIFLVPRLFELHDSGRDLDTVWGVPLVHLRRAAHRSVGWRVKRALDVAFAGVAVPVLSPLLLGVALAVRLETGPGVLFRQQRVGLDGAPFDLLKFRTVAPLSPAESATTWSLRGDARVGRVGGFLRRTSLDELPQLLNVLRGDMSLVGPRPERPHFVETFLAEHPHYLARHRVPCGLTGLAQVNGLRGDTSIGQRALFDNYYIENWSLWLDLKILVRTALSVVRGEGS
jgi:exopolysaccharide biosynthesis polyprenyl glycosylphosphotransferase